MSAFWQDPILLEGTVRSNLDPFEQYTDQQVAAAIDKVMAGVGVNDHDSNHGSNGNSNGKDPVAAMHDKQTEQQEYQQIRRMTTNMQVSKDGNNFLSLIHI